MSLSFSIDPTDTIGPLETLFWFIALQEYR
jgi:hypothetical protein